MPQTVRNPTTGQVLQRRGRGWIDVTPTNAEIAAADSSAFEAFGVNVANTALNFEESLEDLTLATLGLTGIIDEDISDIARAKLLADSTERNVPIQAVQEARPVASFLGDAAAMAPLMFVPGSAPGTALRTIAAREAALAGAEGFLSRPGSIGQRVSNAAVTAALGGAGAMASVGISGGVNRLRTMNRNGTESTLTGTADLELSARNIELEMETAVPRLGEAAQREYDRLASRAVVPPNAAPGSSATVGNMSPFKRELIRQADDLGIAMTTGQRTANDQLRRLEAGLASNPLTSKPWDDLKDFNRRRVNNLALDSIGELDQVTPQNGVSGVELGRATERIGQDFQDVAAQIGNVTIDDEFFKQIDAAAQKHARGVARSQSTARFVKQIREVVDEGGGSLDGSQLMDARSALTRELQRASRAGDGNTMQGIYELTAAIDEQMMRASDPSTLGLYERARGQWRILDALEQGKAVTSGGDVNVRTLDGILRRRYPVEYRRSGTGVDPLFDAVKILTTFSDIVGDSGTATRSFTQQFLDSPVGGTIRGVAQGTAGQVAFRGSQSQLGSQLFSGGRLLADPSRSAARLGTIAGIAAASGEGQQ